MLRTFDTGTGNICRYHSFSLDMIFYLEMFYGKHEAAWDFEVLRDDMALMKKV